MADHTRAAFNPLGEGPLTADIPGGRFSMGSETGRPDEGPVHTAEVEPFRMAITPVTVRQYAKFLAAGGAADLPPWWADPDFDDPE